MLSHNDLFIVSGKFDHRKQQRQLIINEIQTLATFEEQKLAFAKQIIIRNKSQIDMFEEMIKATKENANDVMLSFYDETIKQMTTIGYINQKIVCLIILYNPLTLVILGLYNFYQLINYDIVN